MLFIGIASAVTSLILIMMRNNLIRNDNITIRTSSNCVGYANIHCKFELNDFCYEIRLYGV